MRYGSVCSGIEAATQAWHPLGWEPAFFSEIERFPSAVLAHHYPDVPNLGDMTKFKEWPDVSIDLLVGGTPCQSFSVAGLRKGLADPRGNLALTYLAIAERYQPRWIVWENVPGVLSSGEGRDFGSFLGALGKLGYGFAYRVLDAQYVRTRGHARAVPQRRRRVFVVGHLGDWRRAAAVLFDRESMSGHPAPRREARESLTYSTAPCLKSSGRGVDGDGDGAPILPVAFSCKDHGADAGEISPTLRSMNHDGSHANAGGQLAVAFDMRGRDGGAMPEGPHETSLPR
ncbi:DNA cytosine methyltransferase [Maricaulis sp.]|uniref:DNA cytosine methyltransferase n=1 Tax=Maricaulis sp. TaxID=1486257 RepID=UPI002632048A|nr:DNA cytosine methyltransferase [Maricaulis sp.]MDF1769854.1 DNA cytosine methyltransferase [Maricaulis sp.]